MDDNVESYLLMKIYEANQGFIQSFGVNVMPVLRERVFRKIHGRISAQLAVLDKHPELQAQVVSALVSDLYAEGKMKVFEQVLVQEVRRLIAIYSDG